MKYRILCVSILVCIILSMSGCTTKNKSNTTQQIQNNNAIAEKITPTESDSSQTPKTTPDVTSNEATDSEREGWISDLKTIEKTIKHIGGVDEYLSKEEISKRFSELIDEVKQKKVDQEGCYYRVRNIISELHSAHMNIVNVQNNQNNVKYTSVGFIWFGNELRIGACLDEYEKYLGWKVIKIADDSIQNVIDKLVTINSCETDSRKKSYLQGMLLYSDLSYLGLLNSEDGLELTVEDDQGKNDSFVAKMWYPNEQMSIHNLRDHFTSNDLMPISTRNSMKNLNYCYESDLDHNIMYFQYNACIEMQDTSLEQCFSDMMKEFTSDDGYTNLVIDIRWNNGGFRYLMQNMLKKYKEQLKDKQIDLIIGKDTLSAGYMLIEDCYENCDHVKLYGEETGQAIHNYTYPKGYELSFLPWVLSVPITKDYEKMIVEKYGDVVKGVTPDVSVDQTYEDYMNGIDTVYQRIVDDMK